MPPETPCNDDEAVEMSAVDNGNEASTSHVASTTALCLCSLTHAYLLISVFPYAGFMAMDLVEGVTEETAGSYSGLLASSFMVGRAVSSYEWGKLADVHGRTTVLHISLGLSGIFSILFGVSSTFTWALVFRFLLGLSNGIVGTTKTAASELAFDSAEKETRAMGLVIGMRGWGFLISPALSAALAEPVKQYPRSTWVQQHQSFLNAYPFLLPNVVAALFCALSLVAVKLYVPETLPRERLWSVRYLWRDCCSWWTNLCQTILRRCRSRIRDESCSHDETLPLKNGTPPEQPSSPVDEPTMASIWANEDTRNHLIVYWMYSFVIIAVDEAFPLFCISREAGLGLTENAIGKILSISGLIFCLCQYCFYTTLMHSFGLYGSIHVCTISSVPIIALIPLSLLFSGWPLDSYLSIFMALYRIVANVFFASMAIATNRTVSSGERGTMNGLSMLGASIAKGMGPALAGVFVAFSVSSGIVPPHVGAILVFGVMSLLAAMVAVSSITCLTRKSTPEEQ